MTVDVTKRRDGAIVSPRMARELVASGEWEVNRIHQVINGVSFWRVENDRLMDYCLVKIREWDGQ